ncbi:unnamed protein product [Chironomus riparius]|uniref:Uncharacterized protein n=1 Tax=Chironomus riparius TaxID=315576 RepID=A0A9N9S5B9_9DIPT|nr:unnamed protein product [Chironomus riparius]
MQSFKLLISIFLIHQTAAGGPSHTPSPSDILRHCVACKDVLENAVPPSEPPCIVGVTETRVHITIKFKQAGKEQQSGDCYLPFFTPTIGPPHPTIESYNSDVPLTILVNGATFVYNSYDFSNMA